MSNCISIMFPGSIVSGMRLMTFVDANVWGSKRMVKIMLTKSSGCDCKNGFPAMLCPPVK